MPNTYFLISLASSVPGLNFTTFLEETTIVSPVLGFRPLRSGFVTIVKVPKPTIETLEPASSDELVILISASKTFLASTLDVFASAAIASGGF